MIDQFIHVWTTQFAPALGAFLAFMAFVACLLAACAAVVAAVQTADHFIQTRSKQ